MQNAKMYANVQYARETKFKSLDLYTTVQKSGVSIYWFLFYFLEGI